MAPEEATEEGLPTEALEAAMERGTLSWTEIGELVIPRRTFSPRKERGEPLTPEEPDRLVRLLRVRRGRAVNLAPWRQQPIIPLSVREGARYL